MNKINYLVTGSAGFIGFHLCLKLLKKNVSVIGIDNINDYYDIKLKKNRSKILKKFKNFTFLKIDITNNILLNKAFEKYKPKYVINLAAQAGVRKSITHPHMYVQSNLVGFANILELSKVFKVKHLVYASSSSVYGAETKMPFSEKLSCNNPISFYGATKKANESMAISYSRIHNLPTTGLRFFTVYGPWGRPDMALFKFTDNIINDKPIDLFNFGNHKRDFTYIDDIINGVLKIIYKKPTIKNSYSEIFNIGRGKSEKLIDFISNIEKQLCKKAIKNYKPLQQGDVPYTYASTLKLKKIIGYSPKVNISLGVKKFIIWYKKYYNK
jgi:UDP-glucuronate 4-epimerase